MHKFLIPATLILCLLLSATALAAPASFEPVGFRQTRSTFTLGFDVFDYMLGDFGDVSDVGMAVFAEAVLQIKGYYGVAVRFGSSRAFTHKDFLPFDNGYQYVYFTAAPRFFIPTNRRFNIYLYIQPEISLQVLISNTLVKLTGNDNTGGAAGGSLGVQYNVGILAVSAHFTCQYVWKYDSIYIGGSLGIGISSIIP